MVEPASKVDRVANKIDEEWDLIGWPAYDESAAYHQWRHRSVASSRGCYVCSSRIHLSSYQLVSVNHYPFLLFLNNRAIVDIFARVAPSSEFDKIYASCLILSHWRHYLNSENMTSSTKPEVHNILHCRQRRIEPRSWVTWRTEKLQKFGCVVLRCASG